MIPVATEVVCAKSIQRNEQHIRALRFAPAPERQAQCKNHKHTPNESVERRTSHPFIIPERAAVRRTGPLSERVDVA